MPPIVRSRSRAAGAARGVPTRLVRAASVAACVGVWTPAANAEVLVFAAFPANFPGYFYDSDSFVDFNGPSQSGGTSFTFNTTQAIQRVLITFAAECAKQQFGAARVRILVDPAGSAAEFAAPPTRNTAGDGVLLCALADQDPFPAVGYVSVTASARPSQAGSHTVRVQVMLPTGVPEVSISQAALAVMR